MLIIALLCRVGCPLCGTGHEVRIHGYFMRKVRDPESRQNVEIKIFALFCVIAKQRKEQYTKRILPPFVIPECNIMLSSVMGYLAENAQESINYAKAQMKLGAEDPRTMRRHIQQARQIIDTTTAELTQLLAQQVSFARFAELRPGVGVWKHLSATVAEIDAAAVRMRGAGGQRAAACAYVHLVYAYRRARQNKKTAFQPSTPLNHVLRAIGFDDTS